MNAVLEAPKTEKKASIIPSPKDATKKAPIKMNFHVGKEFIRTFNIPNAEKKGTTQVYHLYPLLTEYVGRMIPDSVNPRSHTADCLKSPVARAIEQTINEKPEDFYLANRGSTLIAHTCLFDPKTGYVTIEIVDPNSQGLADGATTDAVLAKIQTQMAREVFGNKSAEYLELLEGIRAGDSEIMSRLPETLKNGRIHLEVFVGLSDRERIASLVQGRNTSRQVKGWSIADFKGEFDFIKDILESDNSPLKGKIGYEENSGQEFSVLDILALLTLFHPEFDLKDETGKDKAPVIAYSNRGRIDSRLNDPKTLEGYKSLAPIVSDILRLHDYIYAGFESAYEQAFTKARLGRREGVKSFLLEGNPMELGFTGLKSNYKLPNGYIFPLLAAFRALVKYQDGLAIWQIEPFGFWDKHARHLVAELISNVDEIGGSPNKSGKTKTVYTALHKTAQLDLYQDLEEKKASKE